MVIGGSPRFVNAVLGPLASSVGDWPEVAPDPQAAMALCGSAWLAVLEMQGDEWLGLPQDLRAAHGPALGIVVAVPPDGGAGQAGAGADELVSWDGAPGPVLEAVERLAPGRQPAPPAPPPPEPPTEEHLVEVEETPPAEPEAAAARPGPDSWPAMVQASRSEAESVLAGAVAGLWPHEAVRPLAERVVVSLSELEKAALRGDPIPLDPGPIRRAAALRWVVTAALESAPAPGSPVDGRAVQAILGEIDGALGELKGLAEGVGPDVPPALEALRHLLVKEAIDLTDAVHRIVPYEIPTELVPRPPPAPRKERSAPRQAISFGTPGGPERGRRRGLWIALAVAILVGAAFHGWNLMTRKALPPRPTLPGAPEATIGTFDLATGIATLTFAGNRPPSAADLEKFRAREELKGRVVREVAPGVYVSEPAHRAEGRAPASSRGHP